MLEFVQKIPHLEYAQLERNYGGLLQLAAKTEIVNVIKCIDFHVVFYSWTVMYQCLQVNVSEGKRAMHVYLFLLQEFFFSK